MEKEASGFNIRNLRPHHIAAVLFVLIGAYLLADLTARDLRAVAQLLATTNLGQTENDVAVFGGYAESYDAPNAHGFEVPVRVGLDTVNHRLFVVSAAGNNGKRVGVFQLNADETIGSRSLFASLGQTGIKGFDTSTTQSTFGSDFPGYLGFNPTAVQMSVPDTNNHRVMLFDVADVTNGEPAVDLVGQIDENGDPVFTADESDGPLTARVMNFPRGVAHDPVNHRLFVADTSNSRVLVFDLDADDIPLDNEADFVLGQDDFTENDEDSAQNKFSSPAVLAFDPTGNRLFVADPGNGRVVVFDTASIDNGEDAVNVLGFEDYDGSSCAGGNACSVGSPQSVAYDDANQRLFVGDADAVPTRVMVFDLSLGITDGMDAAKVLGAADFSGTPCPTPGQCDFDTPGALAYDGTPLAERLFLADSDNSRVLVFDVTTITDGEDAVNVLGNNDFTGTPCLGVSLNPNQCSTYSPTGLGFDEAGNRLFVGGGGVRILVFNVTAITDGEDATGVLGQEDFDTLSGADAAADRLNDPQQLAYVPVGSADDLLYVADRSNSRVVAFGVDTVTDGEDATVVLGQEDENGDSSFTANAPNGEPNARGLDNPIASLIDTVNHRMFVSDTGNHRVLVYDLTVGDLLIDRIADNVLGQPDFSSDANFGPSSTSFSVPTALAYDGTTNRLFVSDSGQNRVMVFDISDGITNGEGAINVLGQPDFTTTLSGTTSTEFDGSFGVGPRGLAFDDDIVDRLFVTDPNNGRIMVFDVTAITDGEPAINVLGQEDFFTVTFEVDADSLVVPQDVAFSVTAGLLFVADQGNHRVMVFDVAAITDGEDAVDVLGQTDDTGAPLFTSDGPHNGPNKNGFNFPRSVVVDSVNQRLWITDAARVTQRDLDAQGDLVDIFPEVVLGQSTFKTNAGGTTQSSLENTLPALAADPAGDRLFVADALNHRVMVYDFGLSGLASGAPADFVIGQPTFVTGGAGSGPDGLDGPYSLAYDAGGDRLFVGDFNNNRVLVFDVSDANLNTEATGSGIAMDADAVLGQPNMITTTADTSQTGLAGPLGLEFDDAGDRLFVVDIGGHRVMVFDVATVTNGEPAVAVLGQPDFVSNTANVTQAGLSLDDDSGVAYDPEARTLFVLDNNRVMAFDVAAITDGEDAVAVVGQSDFVSQSGGRGQDQVSNPQGLGWDPEHRRLYVADGFNERVMVFDIVRITTTDLPDATVGESYSAATNADQTQGTLTFSLESGTLPPGLSVGSVTGTPTTPGTYTFTLRGTDTNGPSEFYDLQTYTMTVDSVGGGGGGFVPPPGSTPTPSAGGSPAPTVPGATPSRTPTGSRTPTPTTIAGVSPGPTSSGMPTSPGPSTSPGPGAPTAVDRLLGDRALERVVAVTSMLLAVVSIIAILLSAILLSRNLMDLAFMGAFALQSLWVILGLKKRAHIWGTVYDTGNKHPIPFAKVELTDLNGRVLETRFADRDGRYGFLASPEQVRQQSLTVRIKPTASGYLFPPINLVEGVTDFLVYDHVYTGGPVTVAADSFLRYDIPMYRQPWRSTRFSEFFPIKSAGGLMSHVMNIAFWAGVVLVPLAYWQQPTTLNLVVLILFFGVHALRMLTGMYRPFGVVRDVSSSKAVPYALVTLNDATGKRRTFAVSDEQGRYFMSSDAGTYQLQAFTPANVSPQRSQTTSVTTGSGWVKKKLAV